MMALGTGTKEWLLRAALLFSCPVITGYAITPVQAAQPEHDARLMIRPTAFHHPYPIDNHLTITWDAGVSHPAIFVGRRNVTRAYGISCVPYAREVSGIMVPGNAWQWWNNAEGRYARGDRPEVGSVLNFRANGRMRLGHVAVVTRVVNPREVIIDHANWPSGGSLGGAVSRNVAVVDVSEANNWSAVRVELGHEGNFGSVYPTYGFIYNRPDPGVVFASIERPAPQAAINPVPSDLRPAAERPWRTLEELAESAERPQRGLVLRVTSTPVAGGR